MATRRPLAVVSVALLVLAACGGGKKTASLSSSKATTSTTASGGLPAAEAGGAPAGTGAAAGASGGGGGATATVKAGTTATTARSGASPSGTPTTAASKTASPSASSTPGAAAPGTYKYHVTGTSSFSTAPVNGEATTVYDAPQNGSQHNQASFSGSTTDQVLKLQSDGAFLTSLKTANQALTKDFTFNPPVLAFPTPSAGRSWSWTATSSDGQTTVKASFKVTGTQTLTIGGEAVATTTVDSQVDTTGDITSTTKTTLWVSEKYSLVVQHHDVANGNYKAAFTFSSDTTSTLEATKPA